MAEPMTALYADQRALKAAHDAFVKNNHKHVQLRNALRSAIWKKWWAELRHVQWEKKYVPDLFSYSVASVPQDMKHFFQSPAFRERLSLLTGQLIQQVHMQLFVFAHQDYTLLHDELRQQSGIIFFLELTQKWQYSWGGFISFVENGKETLRLHPVPNSLTIVQQEKNVQYFVKYVNFYAGDHQRIVLKGTCL